MKKLLLGVFLVVMTAGAFVSFLPAEVEAQRANLGYVLGQSRAVTAEQPAYLNSFTVQNATGATAALVAPTAFQTHSIQLVVTGGPAGCTYRLQGSNDGGTTWYNISASDITCTSTTNTFEVDKPAPRVRGNLLTLSGGTTPTVRLHYVGVQ